MNKAKIGVIAAAAAAYFWLTNRKSATAGTIKTQQTAGGAMSVNAQGKTDVKVMASAAGSPAGWLRQWASEPDAKKRRAIKQRAFNKANAAGLAFESESTLNGVPLPETFGAWAPTGNRPAFYALANYIKLGFRFSGEGIHAPAYVKANFRAVFEDWAAKYGMPLNW